MCHLDTGTRRHDSTVRGRAPERPRIGAAGLGLTKRQTSSASCHRHCSAPRKSRNTGRPAAAQLFFPNFSGPGLFCGPPATPNLDENFQFFPALPARFPGAALLRRARGDPYVRPKKGEGEGRLSPRAQPRLRPFPDRAEVPAPLREVVPRVAGGLPDKRIARSMPSSGPGEHAGPATCCGSSRCWRCRLQVIFSGTGLSPPLADRLANRRRQPHRLPASVVPTGLRTLAALFFDLYWLMVLASPETMDDPGVLFVRCEAVP